jgi:DNA replication and repair protein RecF
MIIEQIRLKHFRNITEAKIEDFSGGLNLFYGPNGAGKTNVLEAVGLGSLAKSCRGALDSELVQFGARAATVEIDGIVQKKKLILKLL